MAQHQMEMNVPKLSPGFLLWERLDLDGGPRISSRVSYERFLKEPSRKCYGNMRENADLEGKEDSQSYSLDYHYLEIFISLSFTTFIS